MSHNIDNPYLPHSDFSNSNPTISHRPDINATNPHPNCTPNNNPHHILQEPPPQQNQPEKASQDIPSSPNTTPSLPQSCPAPDEVAKAFIGFLNDPLTRNHRIQFVECFFRCPLPIPPSPACIAHMQIKTNEQKTGSYSEAMTLHFYQVPIPKNS